ncbi:hypothetical protein [Bradyrhizobium icense]|uniref:hypothetical protein n=1 Tax=Bradyrhizobium icense TaxID=1274631 RepID=UPI0012EADCF2|nr:hypothetical protein [Bradyrhizobium icense]
MNALVGSKTALKSGYRGVNREIPVLRRAKAQAEAGPLMLMVRRANMGLSIAGGRENRKGLPAGQLIGFACCVADVS